MPDEQTLPDGGFGFKSTTNNNTTSSSGDGTGGVGSSNSGTATGDVFTITRKAGQKKLTVYASSSTWSGGQVELKWSISPSADSANWNSFSSAKTLTADGSFEDVDITAYKHIKLEITTALGGTLVYEYYISEDSV